MIRLPALHIGFDQMRAHIVIHRQERRVFVENRFGLVEYSEARGTVVACLLAWSTSASYCGLL